jgi:hypothetical protein
VTASIFLIGPGNPDEGAVYCIGGGTLDTFSGGETMQLTGLSRLGTCMDQPVVGSLTAGPLQ